MCERIPDELLDRYTLNNKIEILSYYFDDRNTSKEYNWNDEFISNWVDNFTPENIKNNKQGWEPYYGTSKFILEAIEKYNITNMKVAVVGTLEPWIEAILLNFNNTVSTIEYNIPKNDIKNYKLDLINYNDFKNTKNLYDCIITFSSIEHSGLGRYGDPLNPEGDIIAMNDIYNNLKKNGLVIWGAPVGEDKLFWNAHRIYGKIRLELIFDNFNDIEWLGYDKETLLNSKHFEIIQPVVILEKKPKEIICEFEGGLGNQLFQIFNTISYCLDTNSSYVFYNSYLGYRKLYWDNFLSNLKNNVINQLPEKYGIIKEDSFSYKNLKNYNVIDNKILIKGYFQSYKYFEHNFDKICEIINIKNKISNDENVISLHLRIGDYKYFDGFTILPIDYYINSIKYIINETKIDNYKIIFFYEKIDEDNENIKDKINLISSIYPKINIIKCSDDLTDYEEMLLMSNCTHNIIANSTFSYWGAFLNKNKNKIVTYPSLWFNNNLKDNNLIDLFPESWIKINF